jgi:hypothetical protein
MLFPSFLLVNLFSFLPLVPFCAVYCLDRIML